MTTLKELANREYISFSGIHTEMKIEQRNIWKNNGSHIRFNDLGAEMAKIKSDAEAVKEIMFSLGYKAWLNKNKLPRHYLRRGSSITELVTDHCLDTEEKGIYIYRVRSDGVDDLMLGKTSLSLWDAAATVVVTYAGTSGAMYFVDGPENAHIALAGLSALMGLFVAGTGAIERRRMRPELLFKGTDKRPNSALLELKRR